MTLIPPKRQPYPLKKGQLYDLFHRNRVSSRAESALIYLAWQTYLKKIIKSSKKD